MSETEAIHNDAMPKVTFITHDGQEFPVDAEVGRSLMQVALDNLVPGIIGECGGTCSCATCHGYIDEHWAGRVPAGNGVEADLLSCALDVRPTSRLTCQIPVTDALDGIVVRLPEVQA
jgi:2Fe-2S ferredoxin